MALPPRPWGRCTTTPRNPNAHWHQAQQTGIPLCPCQPPGSSGPSPASPLSPPSSHTFPHLSRAEPELQIISASKKSGSMAMYFGTPVSKIPPTGWLCRAEPAPLRCSIYALNPNHVGAEHLKPMEPYEVRALLLPGPTCCFLALKMPFF